MTRIAGLLFFLTAASADVRRLSNRETESDLRACHTHFVQHDDVVRGVARRLVLCRRHRKGVVDPVRVRPRPALGGVAIADRVGLEVFGQALWREPIVEHPMVVAQ